MKKLTVEEIRKAAAGELITGNDESIISGIEMDSRVIKAGDCFLRLQVRGRTATITRCRLLKTARYVP